MVVIICKKFMVVFNCNLVLIRHISLLLLLPCRVEGTVPPAPMNPIVFLCNRLKEVLFLSLYLLVYPGRSEVLVSSRVPACSNRTIQNTNDAGDSALIRQYPRHFSYAYRAKSQPQDMLKQGTIQPNCSPWVFSLSL